MSFKNRQKPLHLFVLIPRGCVVGGCAHHIHHMHRDMERSYTYRALVNNRWFVSREQTEGAM